MGMNITTAIAIPMEVATTSIMVQDITIGTTGVAVTIEDDATDDAHTAVGMADLDEDMEAADTVVVAADDNRLMLWQRKSQSIRLILT